MIMEWALSLTRQSGGNVTFLHVFPSAAVGAGAPHRRERVQRGPVVERVGGGGVGGDGGGEGGRRGGDDAVDGGGSGLVAVEAHLSVDLRCVRYFE